MFTRLLLDEIYHLIELPFEWLIDDAMFVCLLDELILGFCYNDWTFETGGFELASTITLVLQANRLTKWASHPKILTKILTPLKIDVVNSFEYLNHFWFFLKVPASKVDSNLSFSFNVFTIGAETLWAKPCINIFLKSFITAFRFYFFWKNIPYFRTQYS